MKSEIQDTLLSIDDAKIVGEIYNKLTALAEKYYEPMNMSTHDALSDAAEHLEDEISFTYNPK